MSMDRCWSRVLAAPDAELLDILREGPSSRASAKLARETDTNLYWAFGAAAQVAFDREIVTVVPAQKGTS